MNFDKLLFPHEKVRDIQEQLILKIDEIVNKGKNLIVHAPTGLGKTAAALAPTLQYAIKHDKVVFFLTSRHTQHKIAIDTLKQIKKKYDKDFSAVSIIGKKGLCLQPGVHTLYSSEFHEYCRAMREDKKCTFYEQIKKKEKLSSEASATLSELKVINPVSTEEAMKICEKYGLCPYEISLIMAKKAKVIIGDYYYLFSPNVSNSFLKKTGIELKNAIIIVDEAHNLPMRVKDLFTNKLTNIMLRRAISEAKKYDYEQIGEILEEIKSFIDQMCDFEGEEKYIKKDDFFERVNQVTDYDELIEDLTEVSDSVREQQKSSYIGSIALFLQVWKNDDKGFTRIAAKQEGPKEIVKSISFRCLDPGIFTKDVIESVHSTILMSGTLTPTSMYKEILGFEEAEEATFGSPFPEENRLNIIIPKTSTKYDLRNPQQYKDMAEIISKVVNKVPGNSAVFFPSYYLRDVVYKNFNELCNKTIFVEHPSLSKHEKQEMLEKFKSYKDTGAVLLGVISGSFGEGIDLPGDYLKTVVVVGLPLTKPDLESNALIDYFDTKFGKGWDYGYLFPAFNKTLQSAGRCIRSEKDKGVIIFLDERYTWNNYYRCFPTSWNIKTTMLYEKMISDFFEKSS